MTFINLGKSIINAELITWIEVKKKGGVARFAGDQTLDLSVEELKILLKEVESVIGEALTV